MKTEKTLSLLFIILFAAKLLDVPAPLDLQSCGIKNKKKP